MKEINIKLIFTDKFSERVKKDIAVWRDAIVQWGYTYIDIDDQDWIDYIKTLNK